MKFKNISYIISIIVLLMSSIIIFTRCKSSKKEITIPIPPRMSAAINCLTSGIDVTLTPSKFGVITGTINCAVTFCTDYGSYDFATLSRKCLTESQTVRFSGAQASKLEPIEVQQACVASSSGLPPVQMTANVVCTGYVGGVPSTILDLSGPTCTC